MKADIAPYPSARSARLLTGAAVAVPLLILLLAGWGGYHRVQAAASARSTSAVRALAAHAVAAIKSQELVMDAVEAGAATGGWNASSESLQQFLRQAVARGDGADAIALIEPEGQGGQVVFSTSPRSAPAAGADSAASAAARNGGGLHFGSTSSTRGEPTFSLARRIPSLNGAVLMVTMDPAYFSAAFYALAGGTPDGLALARSGGELLFRSPTGEEETAEAATRAVRDGPPSGLHHTGGILALQQLAGYPLYLAYGHPRSAIWSQWRLIMSGYAVIALCAAAALLAAAALARRRVRRALAATAARARETAQRSAAQEISRSKDDFLTALNHELRSPLSAIAASVEVLGRIAIPDPRGRQALLIMGRQLDKMKRLLSDLLDTSRAIYGELPLRLQPVDLMALARGILATRPQFFKGDVRIEVAGGPVWAQADPDRVRQMLESLLENAQKFGGRHIRIDIAEEEQCARLTVSDDGDGIRQDLLPRLFEPLVLGERAIGRTGGLGLGLSLVQRLALLQHGSVTAASEGRGRGSRFSIRLPKATRHMPALERPAAASTAPKRRILILEDQADARQSLQTVLEMEGHKVAVASDGVEGLAKFRLFDPEIVLVDIGLPGMDGYEWGRRIRTRYGATGARLVALTGYGQDEDRQKARDAGFDGHLTKPVSYAELQYALQ